MNNTGTTQVNLTERTKTMIEALKSLNEAESRTLEALTLIYGEEHGTDMTSRLPFELIRKELSSIMGIVICENQSEDDELV